MNKKEIFLEYRKNPTVENRNQIVEQYLYMVEILIKKYLHKGVEYEDLYQVGAMALISAVERYNPEKGFEFSSFAVPTILGEIKKYFRDKEWRMKVPRRIKEVSLKITSEKELLTEKLGRTPTVQEIAEHMNLDYEEVVEVIESSKAYNTYSLDQTNNNEEVLTYDKFTSVDELGYKSIEDFELIKGVFRKLNEKEKNIFKLRYLQSKTQMEIADMLKISQMTVSRTEKIIRQKFHEEIQR